jgi:hypothetical protein
MRRDARQGGNMKHFGNGFRFFAAATLLALGAAAAAAELAVIRHVGFDADAEGSLPSTGDTGEPTSLVKEPGTSIMVQATANGIATKPVVLLAQGANQYVSVDTAFPPVAQGLVRVEATVSFDRFARGYFLQTSVGTTTAVVSRLLMTEAGEIKDFAGNVVVGAYVPNQPFRVRMDIDMTVRSWSVAIDDEMNGFEDDPVTPGLAFGNDDFEVPSVGAVGASMQLGFPVAPTAVAYDDIEVSVMTEAVSLTLAPGPFPGVIVPRSRLQIALAIPSTASFDAATVSPATVRFGPTGTEAPAASFALDDFDHDGDADLVLRFRTEQTGIQCGDTSAMLTGRTYGGIFVAASVAFTTTGCGGP